MKHLKAFFSVFLIVLSASVLLTDCTKKSSEPENTPRSLSASDSLTIQTAREAFLYGLPLVLMDISRRQMTDMTNNMYAPVNTFRHLSDFPDASFRSVVRPNADTYYSAAMLDLTTEPVVLSLPDTQGRYYMMPMLDAYTNVFTSPGSRTTGTKAGVFLITGPQWTGTVPANMKEIKAPTNMAWLIGRTQVNSKADGEKVVVPLQKKYLLTPLSAYGKTFTPPAGKADPSVPKGSPNDVVEKMPAEEYFNYVNRLLATYPPPADNKEALDKFAAIGIKPGEEFSMAKFSTEVQAAIKNVPEEVLGEIRKYMTNRKVVNGWSAIGGKQGSYGIDYQQRAFVAYMGLGANLAEDAMYPSTAVDSEGNALNGTNKYILHFDKGQTPPANAFWSLTMYDHDGYFIPNPINRYTIGDRSDLKQNKDGSIDIYIQQESPGKEKESNWLPAPPGEFNILMRVYWPKEEMTNGSWKTSPVTKVN